VGAEIQDENAGTLQRDFIDPNQIFESKRSFIGTIHSGLPILFAALCRQLILAADLLFMEEKIRWAWFIRVKTDEAT
jgi:hypothetical protein